MWDMLSSASPTRELRLDMGWRRTAQTVGLSVMTGMTEKTSLGRFFHYVECSYAALSRGARDTRGTPRDARGTRSTRSTHSACDAHRACPAHTARQHSTHSMQSTRSTRSARSDAPIWSGGGNAHWCACTAAAAWTDAAGIGQLRSDKIRSDRIRSARRTDMLATYGVVKVKSSRLGKGNAHRAQRRRP